MTANKETSVISYYIEWRERERANKQSTKSVDSIRFVFLLESAFFPLKAKAMLRSPGNTLSCTDIQSNCVRISKNIFWTDRMPESYPHSCKGSIVTYIFWLEKEGSGQLPNK